MAAAISTTPCTTLQRLTEVTAIPGDVADPEHRRALMSAAGERLDLLVNNASILGPSPQPRLARYPLGELARVYQVNVVAPLALVQLALPRLVDGGRIINITSDAAVEAYEGWGGYGSSKAALEQISAILAAEHPELRVYTVDPGDMRTRMHQEAFPGEDISDREPPEASVPGLLSLIEGDFESGRYRARELVERPRERRCVRPAADARGARAARAPRRRETDGAGQGGAARSNTGASASCPSCLRPATWWSSTCPPRSLPPYKGAAPTARRSGSTSRRKHPASTTAGGWWSCAVWMAVVPRAPRPGRRSRWPAAPSLSSPHPTVPRSGSIWRAFEAGTPLEDYLFRHGQPIRYGYVREGWPLDTYQNVYATTPGSAEMPSAGRPFTPELITQLVARGVLLAPITLHTGVSSPERHEPPFAEQFEVPPATARLVQACQGRVIAVGTTVVRALETMGGEAGCGWTNLVIDPLRGVRVVDGLITGWHQPEASHLQMLEAIAGTEPLQRAYDAALAHGYRWHEFGDSHLIL